MKEQVTTLEVGKCYQVHHGNDVLHLIRVNKEFIPLVNNTNITYMVAEVWGSDTIDVDAYHSIRECDTYTEITQEQFKAVLNSILGKVSNYISTMN